MYSRERCEGVGSIGIAGVYECSLKPIGIRRQSAVGMFALGQERASCGTDRAVMPRPAACVLTVECIWGTQSC